MLRLVAVLAVGAAASAPAQLAVTQPTEKLLVLPLWWAAPGDSAAAIAITDAARERLGSMVRYKVLLISKDKMCEALRASGFPCDGNMDARQAEQLARFLNVPSYTLGTLGHSTASYAARIHVVSGGSGFSSTFTVTGGANGTPQPISEAIAQRLSTIIRAAESARNCNEARGRNNLPKAADEARKALTLEPNLPAAHLCLASVYEIQRLGPDSIIKQATAALLGDSLNGEAWNRMANAYLAKGDTTGWLGALAGLALSDAHNTNTTIGVATLFGQHKQFEKATALLDKVIAVNPGNAQLVDLKKRMCIEGGQWRCVLDIYHGDTTAYGDTAVLRIVIGAAQQLPDTQAMLLWTRIAAQHFPRNTTYQKAWAGAYEMVGQLDSALAIYIRTLPIDPSDVKLSLQVAKLIVDRAVYDTAKARLLTVAKDTVTLHGMQAAFATKVDSARPYLRPGLSATDSTQRLSAEVIMLNAGSKIAQASAYDRAYPLLDSLLTLVEGRAPTDQVRINTSFWYGLSSVLTLGPPYQVMIKSKNCGIAKEINDRIQRTKTALQLGGRIAPSVGTQMLGFLGQYDANMPKVKQAFKCHNF